VSERPGLPQGPSGKGSGRLLLQGTTAVRRPGSQGGSQQSKSLRALRASAVVHWISGVSSAVVIPWTLVTMARERQIQTGPFGIRSLAGGPFEQLGIDWMVGLGWVYVGLSVLEVLAGVLLWQRRRGGAWLGVGLILPLTVFWVGFALPFHLWWRPFVFGCSGLGGGLCSMSASMSSPGSCDSGLEVGSGASPLVRPWSSILERHTRCTTRATKVRCL
jgi:hypothetical protein